MTFASCTVFSGSAWIVEGVIAAVVVKGAADADDVDAFGCNGNRGSCSADRTLSSFKVDVVVDATSNRQALRRLLRRRKGRRDGEEDGDGDDGEEDEEEEERSCAVPSIVNGSRNW